MNYNGLHIITQQDWTQYKSQEYLKSRIWQKQIRLIWKATMIISVLRKQS